jgi:toxin-antitoxin system PIN domain toxin
VIAVDTNVLVYAHREEGPRHERAKRRLTELAEGDAPWAIPVFCLGEFLRVVTHPRVFDPPFEVDEACQALSRVLGSPTLRILQGGPRYPALLVDLVRRSGATGNLVFDAMIAAICIEAGVSALLTDDRDFDRFRGLRIERL